MISPSAGPFGLTKISPSGSTQLRPLQKILKIHEISNNSFFGSTNFQFQEKKLQSFKDSTAFLFHLFNRMAPQPSKLHQFEQNKRTLPHMTTAELQQIHLLFNQGFSKKKIAAIIGCSKSSVIRTIKKVKETKSYDTKKRSGRPKKTSERIDRHLVTASECNRRLTSTDLKAKVQDKFSVNLSRETICRRLRKAGLFGRPAAKKPLLRQQNRLKRLAWALEHQHWTKEQWNRVCFTDESPFRIFDNTRQIVRIKKGEEIRPDTVANTVKHGGGGIMVWGCFMGTHVGDIHLIDGTMDKNVYHSILVHHGLPSARKLAGGWNFTWQEDNDPKHTSKLCKDYLKSKKHLGMQLMTWPAQSPDLNPIELLWAEIKRRVRKLLPTTKQQLWELVQQVWNSIEEDFLSKLIDRMPFICQLVINNKGGYFKEQHVWKQCIKLGLVAP